MNTQPNPTLRIAIIGSGAAGYFAAIEPKSFNRIILICLQRYEN